jgi:ABC-type dipeptide/oligopeptide/nickel transport system permease component
LRAFPATLSLSAAALAFVVASAVVVAAFIAAAQGTELTRVGVGGRVWASGWA